VVNKGKKVVIYFHLRKFPGVEEKVFSKNGVLEWWSTGGMEYWSTGVME